MRTLEAGAFCAVMLVGSVASAFDSGSDGSLLDFPVTGVPCTGSVVIPLPPNGVLNYRNFTVPTGCNVTFERNSLNTPVYILATGDITVVGTVSVTSKPPTQANAWNVTWMGGLGGPGGSEGGSTRLGIGYNLGTPGNGPGGANAYHGGNDYLAAGASPVTAGLAYGVAVTGLPVAQRGWWILHGGGGGGATGVGNGSYGGQTAGGAGGGGVITMAATGTITITGGVYANSEWRGNAPFSSGGGGGYVRLVGTTVQGNGVVQARGYNSTGYAGWISYRNVTHGGSGVIRIESDNPVIGNITGQCDPPADYVVGVGAPSRALPFAPGTEPTVLIKRIGGVPVTAAGEGHPLSNIQTRVTAGAAVPFEVETTNVDMTGISIYVRVNVLGNDAPLVAQVTNMADQGGGVWRGSVDINIPANVRLGTAQAYIPQVPVP